MQNAESKSCSLTPFLKLEGTRTKKNSKIVAQFRVSYRKNPFIWGPSSVLLQVGIQKDLQKFTSV